MIDQRKCDQCGRTTSRTRRYWRLWTPGTYCSAGCRDKALTPETSPTPRVRCKMSDPRVSRNLTSLDDSDRYFAAMGCDRFADSRIVTRPDAQGYAGGEHLHLTRHYFWPMVGPRRFEREAGMLGLVVDPREHPHPATLFPDDGGREWHPDVLRDAVGQPERLRVRCRSCGDEIEHPEDDARYCRDCVLDQRGDDREFD